MLRIRRSLLAGLPSLMLSVFASIGPHTVSVVSVDGFDCATAISDSTKQTLLLNIVKLGYGDALSGA